MKRTLLALALVALVIAPAMAKGPNGNNGAGKGKPDDKPNPNKPTTKPEKPPKVCLVTEGWVKLEGQDVARGMLKLNAEVEGKAIAATAGCVHRKTVLQKACSKPGPIPPGVTIYQYRAMELMRCPGAKRMRVKFFARDYVPPIPTPSP